ncbi:MAG: DNA-3-methyladenine glycosylase [Phycisphaeraceae bacterium]
MNRTARPTRLPRTFYERDAITVARALLGQKLVRIVEGERVAGIIVETEAYLGLPDKAAHTFNGRRTQRNASMWLGGGHAYVYFTYGMHHCMNVVAGRADEPVAVLLRGLRPVEGVDTMFARRRKVKRATDLASGPAKLCEALAIDRTLDGTDLVASDTFFIERQRQRTYPTRCIVAGPRVGVHYAAEWADAPLRFHVRDDPHVSPAR